jgi:hypothetical protein
MVAPAAAWAIPAAIAAGQMGASLIGGKQASKASKRAMEEAARMREAALAELAGMEPIQLEALGYDPEMLQYIAADPYAFYNQGGEVDAQTVNQDPLLRGAEMEALQDLTRRSEEGMTGQDQYDWLKKRRDVETAARGRDEAIMSLMNARGMGGTGIEAALKMISGQGQMDRLSEFEAAQAAKNSDTRLQATTAKAGLAGNIRNQDFTHEKSNTDILNDFAWKNSERRAAINNMNTELRNRRSSEETAERRRVEGANTANRNSANLANKQWNIERERQRQQSIRDKQQAMAGAKLGGIPATYAQGAANAESARNTWNTLGQAPMTAYDLYERSRNSEEDRKSNRDLRDELVRYRTQGKGA